MYQISTSQQKIDNVKSSSNDNLLLIDRNSANVTPKNLYHFFAKLLVTSKSQGLYVQRLPRNSIELMLYNHLYFYQSCTAYCVGWSWFPK